MGTEEVELPQNAASSGFAPPSRRTKSSSMNDITPDSTALTSSPSETPIDLDIQALAQQYPWLEGLNPPQMAAATQTTGAVLVLAGAGTGKTRALTTRLAHLLLTGQARPQEILAVTFTNKAAAEMKHRVEAMINHPTEGWFLGTFHSLAARILRFHAELVDLKPNFTILDDDDQMRIIKQIEEAEGLAPTRYPPRLVLSAISRWKDKGLQPSMVPGDEAAEACDGWAHKIYTSYQERLAQLNACDFGDLLLHNLTIFQQHADVLARYQDRFRHLLVDEYQDTNVAQYLWLRLLAAKHQQICCVGDDDQSIYGWRGAEVGNILRFERDFPGAHVIRLEQNYRSKGAILAVASGVIRNNGERLGKTLWTDDEDGDPVTVRGLWDAREEARFIGDEIEAAQRGGTSLNETAVLVRTASMMRTIEERFIEIGLPYKVFGGPRFYERKEIRDAIAYLRLIAQPSDDLAFERIINVPKRGIGDKSVQKILMAARGMGVAALEGAIRITQSDELPSAARSKVIAFTNMIEHWQAQLGDGVDHVDLASQMLEDSGYVDMLKKDKSPDAPGRLENLKELLNAMGDFENLGGFLEHVSLVMDTSQNIHGEQTSLMTLHAAKGMEFDVVFLPGWEDGAFPSMRSMNESGTKGLEEERRLAYVGITRARQNLTISFVSRRMINGQWTDGIPSRFIEELPKDHIEFDSLGSGAGGFAGDGNGYGGPAQFRYGAASWEQAPQTRQWQGNASPGMRRLAANRQKVAGLRGPVLDGTFEPISQTVASHRFGVGDRVFHDKFGYGDVSAVEGDKLVVTFDHAGEKRVVAGFVKDPKDL